MLVVLLLLLLLLLLVLLPTGSVPVVGDVDVEDVVDSDALCGLNIASAAASSASLIHLFFESCCWSILFNDLILLLTKLLSFLSLEDIVVCCPVFDRFG